MKLLEILPRLVSIIALATTFGCATGAKFAGPRPAPEDAALLYVFRPNNPPLLPKPAILVNGVRAADLTNKGYFDLELQPGEYTIKADWSWHSGVPDGELTLHALKGHTYYVLIDSSMHLNGFVPAGVYAWTPTYRYQGGIGLVEGEIVTPMIKECGEVTKRPGVEELIHPLPQGTERAISPTAAK